MSSRLSGKVCIITGTGGSIGREAARTFAREGALVVGCDLTVDAAQATVDMVREAGGTMVSLHPCHLTKPADCQSLVDLALTTFGRIDVLFNNAAMATSTGSKTSPMTSGIAIAAKRWTWCSTSLARHGRI